VSVLNQLETCLKQIETFAINSAKHFRATMTMSEMALLEDELLLAPVEQINMALMSFRCRSDLFESDFAAALLAARMSIRSTDET
jgi:hypothetical protein